MKARVLSFLLLAVLLSACSPHDTLKFNDTIVNANEDLRLAADEFNKKVDSVQNSNYSGLEADRQKMVMLIDQRLKEVGNLKADMPGGEDFKNTFIDYYKFEKDIYETDFKTICTVTGKGDVEKLAGLHMEGKSQKEDAMEKNIHKEQENFARKNGLKLK
jgi:hypothetical protein